MKYIIGLRKFIIVLLIIILSIVFRITDLFSGAETVDIIKSVSIAFIGANVSNKILDTIIAKFKGNKNEN